MTLSSPAPPLKWNHEAVDFGGGAVFGPANVVLVVRRIGRSRRAKED